ncbi:hypothetical protein P7C71_g278, partial [Lecanoromycetidae sp. Uapishka_2]
MLGRIAVRSLRIHITPAPVRAALPSFQSRSYAKNDKPRRPADYKIHNTGVPNSQDEAAAQRPGASVTSSSNRPLTNSTETNPHPDYSKLQDEFQTSAPSDGNTEPQSSSPSAVDPAQVQQQGQGQRPTQPLPDLTKGIPSTIDAELASASSQKADPSSLNITEAPSEPGGQGGGDLPREAYVSSFERRRNRFARWFYISAFTALTTTAVFLGRNWETEEEELAHPNAPSGWSFKLFWKRIVARYDRQLDYYNEPAFPKLLPDTDPVWERPYTLVLSLEDIQYYELVIFTSVPSMLGGPIISKLDPYRIVMWPLFREATRYKDGEYIKPENAIIIPKWKGDPKDRNLVSYIPFLEFIGAMVGPNGKGERDVRPILQDYQGTHVPTEFARRSAIAEAQFKQKLEADRAKGPKRSVGFLGSLLGGKPQVAGIDGTLEQSLAEGLDQGKSYQELIRERGQKQYEMLEREIQQNGEKWLKDMAEEEKKAMDESMKSMKGSINGFFPFSAGLGGEKRQ